MSARFWTAGAGKPADWLQASNWSPPGTPASGDLDIIQSGEAVATNIGIMGQTVWLYATSNVAPYLDMNGSSFGKDSVVISDSVGSEATINAQNTAFLGEVFDGQGSLLINVLQNSSAVNYGWWGVATGSGEANIALTIRGYFSNSGVMEVGENGGMSIGCVQPNQQYVYNGGIMQVDPGGKLTTYASATATLVNLSKININAGIAAFNTELWNTPGGRVDITNGGTMIMASDTKGGVVQLDGTLEFYNKASLNFMSPINLTGQSATFRFDGEAPLQPGSTKISDVFDPSTNTLNVTLDFPSGNIGHTALQFVGDHPLSAANFALDPNTPNQIIYTASPNT